jgi:hypothetical protein
MRVDDCARYGDAVVGEWLRLNEMVAAGELFLKDGRDERQAGGGEDRD